MLTIVDVAALALSGLPFILDTLSLPPSPPACLPLQQMETEKPKETREQQLGKLAKAEPSLDFEIDNTQLCIRFQVIF